MLEIKYNIGMILIETICCLFFCETFGNARYKGLSNTLQFALLLLANMYLGYIYDCAYDYNMVEMLRLHVAGILVLSLFMYWYVKISLKKSLVVAVFFDVLLLEMDYLGCLISYITECFGDEYVSFRWIPDNNATIVVCCIVKLLLFILFYFAGKQFAKRIIEMMSIKDCLKFLVVPVFTITAVSAMLTSVFDDEYGGEYTALLSVIVFGMVGMNVVMLILVRDIYERERRIHENEIFRIQSKNRLEMYRAISENFDNQKRKTHEYKNQIACIESLLEKKQYSKLEEYVKKVYGSLNNGLDAINTNNIIVNAILNTKYQEADAKGIAFIFRVNDLSGLRVTDEDVVTILSNLLNNAIEACETCEDRKVIKFKFVKENDLIIIAAKNTFNYDIVYENGEIKSTKTENEEEHGVGIKNILKIVEKYEGSYAIKDDNKEFYFSIIIPA